MKTWKELTAVCATGTGESKYWVSNALSDILCKLETRLSQDFASSSLVTNLQYRLLYISIRSQSVTRWRAVYVLFTWWRIYWNSTFSCNCKLNRIPTHRYRSNLHLDAHVRNGLYRPPVADADPIVINDIKVIIDCLRHLCEVDFAVFNLPNINGSGPVLVSSWDYCSTSFSTFGSQQAFEQYVSE